MSPGCCGAWYHQTCIDNVIATGGRNCPMCRHVLPLLTSPASRSTDSIHVTSSALPSRGGIFGSRNAAAPSVPSSVAEDLITPTAVAPGPIAIPVVTVSASPEFPELSWDSREDYYARVNISFDDIEAVGLQKVPVDIVCVLDNSGSMQGSKISSLKKAMDFVIRTLGPDDRLSIVNFNSTATPLHGLLKMNGTNQDTAKAAMHALSAVGGTDIYAGMTTGWSILERRQTKNPASCMFLLTDGQDRDYSSEKVNLARTMKSAGTSLFVFGFGTDHDSEHMVRI